MPASSTSRLTRRDIARARLRSQRITVGAFRNPADVVGWLAAVQAQDFAAAKWALGLRLRGAKDDDVERALNEGSILRTHVLRPTWHFVTPADIRWLLGLTAPRVHAANAHMVRRLGLDSAIFKRSNAALARALQGGRHLTREELQAELERAGIQTDSGLRMAYLMMHAELEGIVCSGPRRGKQFTYALLDERASMAKTMARDEALAELARRFFSSRGPAMVQDFAKWSGLTIGSAQRGLEAVQSELRRHEVDGQIYWAAASARSPRGEPHPTHLLSVYDEYISGYKDRSAIADEEDGARLQLMGNALLYVILLDGQIVGTWRRTLKKDAVIVEASPFRRLRNAEKKAILAAARRYGEFLDKPVELKGIPPLR